MVGQWLNVTHFFAAAFRRLSTNRFRASDFFFRGVAI